MTVSKPSIINKKPSLTKYVCGGKRSRTTKVIWHYTGKAGVKGIDTINNWFNEIAKGKIINGKYVYASANYVMDLDGKIYGYIPMNKIAWTSNSANSYSIGIECATTGKDDHYTDEEYISMVKLGAWLAQECKLDPREDFLTHTDIVGKDYKICPRYFVNNPSDFKQFKLDCYNLMKGKIKVSDIKNWTIGSKHTIVSTAGQVINNKKLQIKVISDTCIVRKVPDFEGDVITRVKKGQYLDVIALVDAKNSSTNMYKLESGLYITSSPNFVEKV